MERKNDAQDRDTARMVAAEHARAKGTFSGVRETEAKIEEFLFRAHAFAIEREDCDRKAKELEERLREQRGRSQRCALLEGEARRDAEELRGALATLTGFKSRLEATKESLRKRDAGMEAEAE